MYKLIMQTWRLQRPEFQEIVQMDVGNIIAVAMLDSALNCQSLNQKPSKKDKNLNGNYCSIYFSEDGELDVDKNEKSEEVLSKFFGEDIYKQLKKALEKEGEKEDNKKGIKSICQNMINI